MIAAVAAAGSILLTIPAVCRAQHEWTHLGAGPARVGVTTSQPGSIASPRWVASTTPTGRPIFFSGQSGVVASRDSVFATGVFDSGSILVDVLFAINRRTGQLRWMWNIPTPFLDSWSTPAVDTRNGTVIAASNTVVKACDLRVGLVRWQTTLSRPVVNASPVVTSDLGLANRAFITDYDAFGQQAKLYCINVDRRVPVVNPYDPGQIVWSVPIGNSSGNTPAYARDEQGRPLVIVASAGARGCSTPCNGSIAAYRADATATPAPLWEFVNPLPPTGSLPIAYFGGVAAAMSGGQLFVYAASYNFDTLPPARDSANLVKLRAATGALAWSTPCNRTASIPVPLSNGKVALSTGLVGYGTEPSVQLFQDNGPSASLVWDFPDAAGGWTHHPAAVRPFGNGHETLYVGRIPDSPFFNAYEALLALDLGKSPGQSGFVKEIFEGAGSSPAIADNNLYTIGPDGLYMFGPPPPNYDVNDDGLVDTEDLLAWDQGVGTRDVNLDGVVNLTDRAMLEHELRRDEFANMKNNRQ